MPDAARPGDAASGAAAGPAAADGGAPEAPADSAPAAPAPAAPAAGAAPAAVEPLPPPGASGAAAPGAAGGLGAGAPALLTPTASLQGFLAAGGGGLADAGPSFPGVQMYPRTWTTALASVDFARSLHQQQDQAVEVARRASLQGIEALLSQMQQAHVNAQAAAQIQGQLGAGNGAAEMARWVSQVYQPMVQQGVHNAPEQGLAPNGPAAKAEPRPEAADGSGSGSPPAGGFKHARKDSPFGPWQGLPGGAGQGPGAEPPQHQPPGNNGGGGGGVKRERDGRAREIAPASGGLQAAVPVRTHATAIGGVVKQEPGVPAGLRYRQSPELLLAQFQKQPGITGVDAVHALMNQQGGVHARLNSIHNIKTQVQLPAAPRAAATATHPAAIAGCHCKKTKCLKLYCPCFAASQYCSDVCKCNNCRNDAEHIEEVRKAIAHAKSRRATAFQSKVAAGGAGAVEHVRGCRCSKSQCLKRYCECYAANVACGSRCKCVGCENPHGRRGDGNSPRTLGGPQAVSARASLPLG